MAAPVNPNVSHTMNETKEKNSQTVDALVAVGWGHRAATISIRAGFRCEYCDKDILGSVDSYYEFNEEHIVPISAGGLDEISNMALSCRTCNFSLKNKWNPETVCGPEASRREKILAVREYVARKREECLERITEFRRIAESTSD